MEHVNTFNYSSTLLNQMSRRKILGSAFSFTGFSLILSMAGLRAQPSGKQRQSKSYTVPQSYQVAEAYEVYSRLLMEEWIRPDSKMKRVLISAQMFSFEICFKPTGEWEKPLGPAILSYRELTEQNWILQPRFNLERPYELVPQETLNRLFAHKAGSHSFGGAYPDSEGRYFVLSPVGLNQNKTVAVVAVGYFCGSLCGMGNFHVVQKIGHKWEVPSDWRRPLCAWVA
jgi:hypothetical protein